MISQYNKRKQLSRTAATHEAFYIHPSFTHQYNQANVTLYKRRPAQSSNWLAHKLKAIKPAAIADIVCVVLWAVAIPLVFNLGSVIVA